MEAGQLEIKKALEEVQVRNIEAVIAHVRESRKHILEQNIKIESLNTKLIAQENLLNQFRTQLAYLQTKVFSGGSI